MNASLKNNCLVLIFLNKSNSVATGNHAEVFYLRPKTSIFFVFILVKKNSIEL